VPVLGISSQVPVAGLGGGRHGYLHELPTSRRASGRSVSPCTSAHGEQLPTALRAAWESAATPPYGPVWVEIRRTCCSRRPVCRDPRRSPLPRLRWSRCRSWSPRRPGCWTAPVNPVILAGGGCTGRGRAASCARGRGAAGTGAEHVRGQGQLRLDASAVRPVLAGGPAQQRVPASADVLLVLGSGLGELVQQLPTFAPRGA